MSQRCRVLAAIYSATGRSPSYRERVILDAELAALYGVSTKRLKEQVMRNAERFPEAPRPSMPAVRVHRTRRHHGRHDPQQPRAVEVRLYVVRAFVGLRELMASNAALARKLDELERKYKHHDEAIAAILSAIRKAMNPPVQKRRGIGPTADIG